MSARAVALRALTLLNKGRIDRMRGALSAERLDRSERAFAWELGHGVVRNERFLDFILRQVVHRKLPGDPRLLAALRLGVYQLLLMDGMPAHAAIYETVRLIQRNQAFVNASLRRVAGMVSSRPANPDTPHCELTLSATRTLVLESPGLETAAQPIATRYSLPDFLVERWRQRHGDEVALSIASASNSTPSVFLRVCNGRSVAELAASLAAEQVETESANDPEVLRWLGGSSPFDTEPFAKGWFLAQDPTALQAARQVHVEVGATVVDLCAAPGTKTMLLAEKVGPEGVVYAYDPDEVRRARIAENAQRLGYEARVRIVDDVEQLPVADAVLADVPCSNTGVLARRVEARRRLTEDSIAGLTAIQAEILDKALQLVRPGGQVVYATCSIEPEENESVVDGALASTQAQLQGSATTLPVAGQHDGGFHAILHKTEGT